MKKKTYLSNSDTINDIDNIVRGAVNRLLLSHSINTYDREDLYQQVWLTILEIHNKKDLRKRVNACKLNTFINAVAHNVVRSNMRKLNKHRKMLLEDIPEKAVHDEEDALSLFVKSCSKLSTYERDVFFDKKLNNMTYDAIGKKYGVSGRTIKRICNRIIKKLIEEI